MMAQPQRGWKDAATPLGLGIPRDTRPRVGTTLGWKAQIPSGFSFIVPKVETTWCYSLGFARLLPIAQGCEAPLDQGTPEWWCNPKAVVAHGLPGWKTKIPLGFSFIDPKVAPTWCYSLGLANQGRE